MPLPPPLDPRELARLDLAQLVLRLAQLDPGLQDRLPQRLRLGGGQRDAMTFLRPEPDALANRDLLGCQLRLQLVHLPQLHSAAGSSVSIRPSAVSSSTAFSTVIC